MTNSIRQLPVIETENTVLRYLGNADVSSIVEFYERNAAHLGKYSPSLKKGYLDNDFWLKRIPEIRKDFEEDKGCNFFLFSKDINEVIGYINFFSFIRGGLHGCVMGYGLAEQAQGQGIMTIALQSAIKYVTQELNMHRIEANYHPDNIRSAKILKMLGFVVEGQATHYLRINGEWCPHVRASFTNHNWQER